jgi:hypothetical protein
MKKMISLFVILLIAGIGLVFQISEIKEINYVESVLIENYLSEVKAGNENTKYALSERHRMYINDKVIIRFNTLGGRRINIEKLSRFLKNADYFDYEIEKQSSLIKKIKEYNDRYLTRRIVFYFPSEGDYRRNRAHLDLSLGKINEEWIVLGRFWDIQIEKNGKPSEFEIID